MKYLFMKITKRDILFFMLGAFAVLVMIIIYDWDDAVKGFNDGINGKAYGVSIENNQ